MKKSFNVGLISCEFSLDRCICCCPLALHQISQNRESIFFTRSSQIPVSFRLFTTFRSPRHMAQFLKFDYVHVLAIFILRFLSQRSLDAANIFVVFIFYYIFPLYWLWRQERKGIKSQHASTPANLVSGTSRKLFLMQNNINDLEPKQNMLANIRQVMSVCVCVCARQAKDMLMLVV